MVHNLHFAQSCPPVFVYSAHSTYTSLKPLIAHNIFLFVFPIVFCSMLSTCILLKVVFVHSGQCSMGIAPSTYNGLLPHCTHNTLEIWRRADYKRIDPRGNGSEERICAINRKTGTGQQSTATQVKQPGAERKTGDWSDGAVVSGD